MDKETFRTGINVDFEYDIDEQLIEPITVILNLLENAMKNKDLFDDDSYSELDEMLIGTRKLINIVMENFEQIILTRCQRVHLYKCKNQNKE